MVQSFIFKLARHEDRQYYFDHSTTPPVLYSRLTPDDAWVAMDFVSGQALTGALTTVANDHGSVTTGTITLDPTTGPYQELINNGAFTLAPQTADSEMYVLVTNGATAGAITTSDYDHVIGDAYATTDTFVYLFRSLVIGGVSILEVTGVVTA